MGVITGGNIIGGAQAPSRIYCADLGSPAAADDDYLVESTNMKVGTYTLAHTNSPDVARNVTVTHAAVGAADTLGTITVTGKDLSGAVISEVITPQADATVQGAKAFKEYTSVVGAGWVINQGNDTIKVGYGNKLGLPITLSRDSVLNAFLNGVRESTRPTVTFNATTISVNTIELDSALNGSAVLVDYYES